MQEGQDQLPEGAYLCNIPHLVFQAKAFGVYPKVLGGDCSQKPHVLRKKKFCHMCVTHYWWGWGAESLKSVLQRIRWGKVRGPVSRKIPSNSSSPLKEELEVLTPEGKVQAAALIQTQMTMWAGDTLWTDTGDWCVLWQPGGKVPRQRPSFATVSLLRYSYFLLFSLFLCLYPLHLLINLIYYSTFYFNILF